MPPIREPELQHTENRDVPGAIDVPLAALMVDVYAGQLMPDEQVRIFAQTERAFATPTARRGAAVRTLGSTPATELPEFPICANITTYDLYGYMSRNRVAGHRLSTGQIEQIIATHPAVAECAVIGADDAVKGMVPVAFAVLKAGRQDDDNLAREIIALVREDLGPVAALKIVHIVAALPKTRSGKILRAVIRRLANGEDVPVPPTIENPDTLQMIREELTKPAG